MNQFSCFLTILFLKAFCFPVSAQNSSLEWVVPLKKELNIVGKPSLDFFCYREQGVLKMAGPGAAVKELPYDSIEHLHTDHWLVWKGELQGVYSNTKGPVLPPVYQRIQPGGWAYTVEKYGMLGVVNDSNKLIVPWGPWRVMSLTPLNDTILEYIPNKGSSFAKTGYVTRQGRAVSMEEKDRYLNGVFRQVAAGKMVFYNNLGKMQRDTFSSVTDFYNGIAVVRKDDLVGYLKQDGSWQISPRFQAATHFYANRVAAAKEKDRYGILKKDGTWLVRPRFENLEYAAPNVFRFKEGNNSGLIDFDGNVILPAGPYGYLASNGSGSFGIRSGDTLLVLNNKGRFLPIPGVVYHEAKDRFFVIDQRMIDENGRMSRLRGIGYTSTGEWFIPPVLNGSAFFYTHFLSVETKMVGLDSLAGVKIEPGQSGKYLIFTPEGKLLTRQPVELIARIGQDAFVVFILNNKQGLLSKEGEVLPAEYDEINALGNSWFRVKKDGMTGLVRWNGVL